jgi:hypothetical protein
LIGREHAWIVGVERNLEIMKRIASRRHLVYLDPHDFKAMTTGFSTTVI